MDLRQASNGLPSRAPNFWTKTCDKTSRIKYKHYHHDLQTSTSSGLTTGNYILLKCSRINTIYSSNSLSKETVTYSGWKALPARICAHSGLKYVDYSRAELQQCKKLWCKRKRLKWIAASAKISIIENGKVKFSFPTRSGDGISLKNVSSNI